MAADAAAAMLTPSVPKMREAVERDRHVLFRIGLLLSRIPKS